MTKLQSHFFIGLVKIPNRTVLAPMAGYTDAAMRTMASKFGVGLTIKEMVSAKGLVYNPEKSLPLLVSPYDGVKSVQLFGHEPDYFYEATRSPHLNAFDIIDINMGCPVPKIVRCGEGSALLNNPMLAEQIVSETVRGAGCRPVTVKIRVGYAENDDVSVEFAKRMVGAGAQAITLHGRTKAQGYAGEADWDKIERLKDILGVPVIGSGDVSENTASTLLERADAIMIGRQAVGNTRIFQNILGGNLVGNTFDDMLEHFMLMNKLYGERYALVNFRHHVGGYLRGVRNSRDIKLALYSATTFKEAQAVIENFVQQK